MGMRFGPVRLPIVLLMAAWLVGQSYGAARADVGPGGAIPLANLAGAPVLQNPGFECKVGYVERRHLVRDAAWLDGGADARRAPIDQCPHQVGRWL